MNKEELKMGFGSKVKFTDQSNVHPSLRDKEFCLLGLQDKAFALIEWDKRGEYFFEYYTGNPNTTLTVILDVDPQTEALKKEIEGLELTEGLKEIISEINYIKGLIDNKRYTNAELNCTKLTEQIKDYIGL